MTDKRTHHRFKCCVTSYVDVLADDIVPLCGAFAAQDRGSARQALDLLFEAGDLARRNGAERVTESDVRRARKLLEKRQIEQSLLDLTTHGHLTLFAIALLANDGETPVRKGHVYDRYGQLAQTLDRDALSDRSVHSHLNELTMLGILKRHEHNQGRSGGVYYEYELSVGLETVASALAEVRVFNDLDVQETFGQNT